MNPGEHGQRPRVPPGPPNGVNGLHAPPGARFVHDQRNGMNQQPQHGGENGNLPLGGQTSRAERFEDEKKRIIESCFGKKEADGSCNLL